MCQTETNEKNHFSLADYERGRKNKYDGFIYLDKMMEFNTLIEHQTQYQFHFENADFIFLLIKIREVRINTCILYRKIADTESYQ